MSETLLLQGFIAVMLWTLEATLLLLMAWCLTQYLQRSAALRHLIWLTAFCGMLIIPCLSAIVPPLVVVHTPTSASVKTLWDKSHPRKWIGKVTRRLPVKVASSLTHSYDARLVSTLRDDSEAKTKPVPVRRYGHLLRLVLLWFWIGGVAVVATSGIGAMYGLFLLRRRSIEPPFDPEYLEELAHRVGLRRKWELRVSTDSRSLGAMTWGIFCSVVLLPKEAMSWPQDRLEAVLLHELAHVHRNDCGSQLLAQIVCALYWFHPAVWLAARAMRADAEAAADDSVLCSGIKPSAYATQLLWFAAHLGKQRQPFSGIGVSLMKESKIESRIQSIVASNRRRYAITSADILKAGSVGLITMMLFAAVRPASSDNTRQESLAPLKPTVLLSTLRQAVRPLATMIRPQKEAKPSRSTRKSRVRRHSANTHRSTINPDIRPHPKPQPMPKADARPHPQSKDVWIKPHVEGWVKPHAEGWVKPHTNGWTKPHNPDGWATQPKVHALTLTGNQVPADSLQTTNRKLTGMTLSADETIANINRALTLRSAQAPTGHTRTLTTSPDVIGHTISDSKSLDTTVSSPHSGLTSADRAPNP